MEIFTEKRHQRKTFVKCMAPLTDSNQPKSLKNHYLEYLKFQYYQNIPF